ncbi:MAG: helix-turn-helix domain-containing protein [Peptococcaceae bacterium]|nr:helix-turn-helix domain-containing protein [Peptococcaceae bacterium]
MEKITVAEVSEQLNISEQTCRSMAKEGLLPFMVPTSRDGKTNYVVFPHLYKLFVTGFDSPEEMAKQLFLMGTAMKKGEVVV